MTLKIFNDVQFDICFDLLIGDSLRENITVKKGKVKEISLKQDAAGKEARLIKDDIWACDRLTFCFYTIDGVLSNAMEHQNLPFAINCVRNCGSELSVNASDLISVSNTSLRKWNKCAVIQSATVCLILAAVLILVSTIIPFDLPFVIAAIAAVSVLFVCLLILINKTKSMLLRYSGI